MAVFAASVTTDAPFTHSLGSVLRDAVTTGLHAEDGAARFLDARGNDQGASVLVVISNTITAAVKAAIKPRKNLVHSMVF